MVDAASLRSTCNQSGVKVGTFVCEFNTPGIGYILKNAGCDFAFIDMEHSGLDVSDLKQLLRYYEAANLPTFVRPPGKDYYAIARVLDMGAEGLILPMIGSVEEHKPSSTMPVTCRKAIGASPWELLMISIKLVRCWINCSEPTSAR